MRLYLIAGEESGDARGAEVMRGLADLAAREGETLEFFGAGGRQMQALAPAIEDWSGEAVVGLWDVLRKYGYFRRKFHAMLREIGEVRPDAVILIDYPGFNLRLAKALRRKYPRQAGTAGPQLIYYISPQVWAWNRRRIPEMARTLDLMLCLFPFEKPLYESSGLKTILVGHPMLDTLAARRLGLAREEALVGLFPGSRAREVSRIFPVMVETARRLHGSHPHLRFEAAAASGALETMMRTLLEAGGDGVPLTIRQGGSHKLMQQAGVGLVASGTATMEAAYFSMPFVLLYKVAPLTWEVGRRLVRVPYLGMVNILAGKAVVPEFLQKEATPGRIAPEVGLLLDDPERRAAQRRELAAVIAGLGGGGAGLRAAEAIREQLRGRGGDSFSASS